jgi:hypothetical protein
VPYDQRFLALLDKLAGAGYSYVSPFWSNYFFDYLPCEPGMEAQSYSALVAR